MSEQECGDGRNDWTHAMHCWDLMRHYFSNGVSVYTCWNLALRKDALSSWGWRQNSLVVVDEATQKAVFTPEYYLLKQMSHFVRRGAERLVTDNPEVLAFANPDKSIVGVMANKDEVTKVFRIVLGEKAYGVRLPPSSVATLRFAR